MTKYYTVAVNRNGYVAEECFRTIEDANEFKRVSERADMPEVFNAKTISDIDWAEEKIYDRETY